MEFVITILKVFKNSSNSFLSVSFVKNSSKWFTVGVICGILWILYAHIKLLLNNTWKMMMWLHPPFYLSSMSAFKSLRFIKIKWRWESEPISWEILFLCNLLKAIRRLRRETQSSALKNIFCCFFNRIWSSTWEEFWRWKMDWNLFDKSGEMIGERTYGLEVNLSIELNFYNV